ncbi:sigma-70 family RNA polymerase sigma factor [Paracraurococcus lichenis]|uniref:Sigma-70 family RNA polymerase sigma factor n=1 Tax=Paracraurococcus lichenis TaxID=3064888 RepID=A0ABT9DV27_9PROT|nr:sigma-70 family RNA polymerase sigma factor [Paracraurococcus sp. LOR1-02]MDO9707754.1 sigma-70 family RNA polymerase sigma factor [Paracraurococcus sp. LOR1-02]
MPGEADPVAHYLPLRGELIGLAYRMTGSVATAEDIAQEVFLRWHGTDRASVAVPRAWMLKAAARLCLDHLKSARVRREHYVGPWLPEPVLDSEDPPQQAAHEKAQDLSVAFLLALQRLGPAERAVFILHDLFETPFAEIAGLLGRSEEACRKLASRARARLGDATPRRAVSDAEARRIARAFLAASRRGEEAALRDLLARDVVLQSDGGGLRHAALKPILGADRVVRLFLGLARKRPAAPPPLLHLGRINGLPGYVTLEPDGIPQSTALEVVEGRIVAIYVMRNPEKLARLSLRPAAGHGP